MEDDNIIVKWAQEDVETSHNLLNKKNIYIYTYTYICFVLRSTRNGVNIQFSCHHAISSSRVCNPIIRLANLLVDI